MEDESALCAKGPSDAPFGWASAHISRVYIRSQAASPKRRISQAASRPRRIGVASAVARAVADGGAAAPSALVCVLLPVAVPLPNNGPISNITSQCFSRYSNA